VSGLWGDGTLRVPPFEGVRGGEVSHQTGQKKNWKLPAGIKNPHLDREGQSRVYWGA